MKKINKSVFGGLMVLTLVSLSQAVLAASPNLVSNPDFELGSAGSPQDWFKGGWGTNNRIFTYPISGHSGNGARVEISSYANGDAKWYFKDVPVLPNTLYEFSDYYKSDVPSHAVIRYTMADASVVYTDIKTGISPSENWKQFSDAFVTPENVVSLTIFHLIKQVGYLETDDYFLVKSESNDPSHFKEGLVSLNFDDGYISDYDAVNSILNPAGFKSTQFIITDYSLNSYTGFATPAQILEMQSQGHEIGSHGLDHTDLTLLSDASSTEQIADSRTALINIGASPLSYFSYPYGSHTGQLEQMVKQAGYVGAVSEDIGYNLKTTDLYALKRQNIDILTSVDQIKKYIDMAVGAKVWLILSFHRIETNYTADIYNTLPQTLQQTVDYLKGKNAKVVTLAEGVYQMTYVEPIPAPVLPPVLPVPSANLSSTGGGGGGGGGMVSLGNYTGSAISAPVIPEQGTAAVGASETKTPSSPVFGEVASAAFTPEESVSFAEAGEEIALESGSGENIYKMLAEPELTLMPEKPPEEMSLAAAILTLGTGNYWYLFGFAILFLALIYGFYFLFKKPAE